MRLAGKFNLILLVVIGLGLAATAFIVHRFLWSNAQDEVVRQARLMMETSTSGRTYTSQNIQPILENVHRKENMFYAESVPAFAALRIFDNLRKQYPAYSYREATLNPTNPDDRAVDWEVDVIKLFRDDPFRKEFIGERDTPNGRVTFLAKPILAKVECQECHSVPGLAPAAMLKLYGGNNGFGWKVGETIGAQIVSVPMSIPEAAADHAFTVLMSWLGCISLITLALFNVVFELMVTRPVKRLAANADEISRGNLDVPEFPVRGKDEVSVLADAFNRMHRSLVKAIKMIQEQDPGADKSTKP